MITSTLSDEQCSITTHSNSIPQDSEHLHTHDSTTRQRMQIFAALILTICEFIFVCNQQIIYEHH